MATLAPAPRFSVNTVPRGGGQSPPARRTSGAGPSVTEETTPLIVTPQRRAYKYKPKGAAKALLLFLGIGQWYCKSVIE